jgi:chemotaxis-related protein WspB
MMRRPSQDFVETGVQSDTAPYLGKVAQDARGLIQWIEVEPLLTPEVREVLFRELIES